MTAKTGVVLNDTLVAVPVGYLAECLMKMALWKLQQKTLVPMMVLETTMVVELPHHTKIAVLVAFAATLVAVETNKLPEKGQHSHDSLLVAGQAYVALFQSISQDGVLVCCVRIVLFPSLCQVMPLR